MIDFHSHVLPKMDDGSKSKDESASMLSSAYEQGVEGIFSTPHFYPRRDDPDSFLRRRERCAQLLFENGEPSLPDLPLYLGAEVAYFFGMSRYEGLDQLSLGGSDYILIEMPFDKWTEEEVEEIVSFRAVSGLNPVIAHFERYLAFGNKKHLKRFLQNEVLLQSNAEFFIDRKTTGKALGYLKRGYISLLGSDCHNTDTRPENYGKAVEIIKKSSKKGYFSRIEETERMILKGAKRYLKTK